MDSAPRSLDAEYVVCGFLTFVAFFTFLEVFERGIAVVDVVQAALPVGLACEGVGVQGGYERDINL
jgi:hypothetical protein